MLVEPSYDLNQLALLADTTPRIVRFYLRQGLLPSPEAQGSVTRFSQEHLDRLRLIVEWQEDGELPLDASRAYLDAATADDVRRSLLTTGSARAASLITERVRSMLAGNPRF